MSAYSTLRHNPMTPISTDDFIVNQVLRAVLDSPNSPTTTTTSGVSSGGSSEGSSEVSSEVSSQSSKSPEIHEEPPHVLLYLRSGNKMFCHCVSQSRCSSPGPPGTFTPGETALWWDMSGRVTPAPTSDFDESPDQEQSGPESPPLGSGPHTPASFVPVERPFSVSALLAHPFFRNM